MSDNFLKEPMEQPMGGYIGIGIETDLAKQVVLRRLKAPVKLQPGWEVSMTTKVVTDRYGNLVGIIVD